MKCFSITIIVKTFLHLKHFSCHQIVIKMSLSKYTIGNQDSGIKCLDSSISGEVLLYLSGRETFCNYLLLMVSDCSLDIFVSMMLRKPYIIKGQNGKSSALRILNYNFCTSSSWKIKVLKRHINNKTIIFTNIFKKCKY